MRAHVCIFGGSGFIGRHLARRLASHGMPVRIVSRRGREGDAGYAEHVTGSIEESGFPERAIADTSAVVNLIGTTSAGSQRAFYLLHTDFPRRLAETARGAGIPRLIHFSAMGAGVDAPSLADRSKAEGEAAVREAFARANIVRPALVYGEGDHFFGRFAGLIRVAPAIPLIGGGATRFQPIHVDDLTDCIVRMLADDATCGRTFELGADQILTFRELIARISDAVGRSPRLVSIPFALAEAGAFATQWLPGAPLTLDQVRLLRTDKIIRDLQGTPAALGVLARRLEPFLSTLGGR